jgi:hypothetical protein
MPSKFPGTSEVQNIVGKAVKGVNRWRININALPGML